MTLAPVAPLTPFLWTTFFGIQRVDYLDRLLFVRGNNSNNMSISYPPKSFRDCRWVLSSRPGLLPRYLSDGLPFIRLFSYIRPPVKVRRYRGHRQLSCGCYIIRRNGVRTPRTWLPRGETVRACGSLDSGLEMIIISWSLWSWVRSVYGLFTSSF